MCAQADVGPGPGTRAPASPRRRLMGIAAAGAWVTVALLGPGWIATAQDQSPVTPQDVIDARKILMDVLDDKLITLERSAQTRELDLADARTQGDTISVLLLAFPHLFPPASNRWKPDNDPDPVTATLASPDIWHDPADFRKRAGDASKVAFGLAHAANLDEAAGLIMQLRVTCDSCHALYLEDQ